MKKTSEERLLEAMTRLLEYNPYHSKDDGRFTSEDNAGTTVAYGGKSGKAAKRAARKERFNRTVGRSSPRLNQELARRLHGEDGGELTASRAVGGITDDKPGRYARMQRAGERPPEFLRSAARNASERAKAAAPKTAAPKAAAPKTADQMLGPKPKRLKGAFRRAKQWGVGVSRLPDGGYKVYGRWGPAKDRSYSATFDKGASQAAMEHALDLAKTNRDWQTRGGY